MTIIPSSVIILTALLTLGIIISCYYLIKALADDPSIDIDKFAEEPEKKDYDN